MTWTVAQTEAQRERIAADHLVRNGFAIFLPLIKMRERVEPLFPGYIFVRIEMQWRRINGSIGILRVLTSCDRPARIADEIITEIRARESRGLHPAKGLSRG